jgi:hypothetical protein
LKTILNNFLKFVIFSSIGGGILYLIYRKQNSNYLEDCVSKGGLPEDCSLLDKLWVDLTTAHIEWIIVLVVLFLLSNVSRALRWMMLLKGLGKKVRFANAFLAIMLNYFTNLGVPRIGEIIRAGVITKYEGLPVEKVIGTVVVDRIVDVISILFAIFLAFVLEYDVIYGYIQENISDSPLMSNVMLVIGVSGLVLLILLWFFRNKIKATRFYDKIQNIVTGFVDGLKTIRSLENVNIFILHSVFIWLMYYFMTYFTFRAFDPTAHLGMSAALIVFVFGGLGVVFPSPGGMGTYHAMVIAALAIYGIGAEDAFSFANIVFFSLNLFCNISIGLLAVFLLPLINRKH